MYAMVQMISTKLNQATTWLHFDLYQAGLHPATKGTETRLELAAVVE
jgi:hypothetical protein